MNEQKSRNPTVYDVAKLAGVSLMTVSRVINNQPKVRSSTRKRVLSAIAQLGYMRNEGARMLKGLPTRMIGLIVPDLSDAFFASCAQTVQRIARSYGYMTLVAASERDSDLEIEQAQLMANHSISGILIVTSTTGGDTRLRQLQGSGLPIVAIDRPIEGISVDSVLVENRKYSEEATRHLIEHGHRNIACIGYDGTVYSVMERVEGYTHVMLSAGYKPNIALDLATVADVERWVAKIRFAKDRPTAIFTLNQITSCQVLHALNQAGLTVPEKMALVGFGDFELAADFSPPFTVVQLSSVNIATRAMALLFDRIKHKDESIELPSAKVVLPATLVVRASCGCKPVAGKATSLPII